MQLHIINIIDNISSIPKTIAKTITADKASNIVLAIFAPIIAPITPRNKIASITAITPKHFVFPVHVFFSLQQYISCGSI